MITSRLWSLINGPRRRRTRPGGFEDLLITVASTAGRLVQRQAANGRFSLVVVNERPANTGSLSVASTARFGYPCDRFLPWERRSSSLPRGAPPSSLPSSAAPSGSRTEPTVPNRDLVHRRDQRSSASDQLTDRPHGSPSHPQHSEPSTSRPSATTRRRSVTRHDNPPRPPDDHEQRQTQLEVRSEPPSRDNARLVKTPFRPRPLTARRLGLARRIRPRHGPRVCERLISHCSTAVPPGRQTGHDLSLESWDLCN